MHYDEYNVNFNPPLSVDGDIATPSQLDYMGFNEKGCGAKLFTVGAIALLVFMSVWYIHPMVYGKSF